MSYRMTDAELRRLSQITGYDLDGVDVFDWGRRKDGRWSLRTVCPDGVIRYFTARRGPETFLLDFLASKRAPRPSVPPRLRFDVLRRDDFRCRYCGVQAPAAELHVDHITPVIEGGFADPANLVTACIACNLGKGPRPIIECPPAARSAALSDGPVE